MKLTFTRASALLAMALGLAACGGKATFELTGPITGLVYPGLVITNKTNGDVVTVQPQPVVVSPTTGRRTATDTSFKMNQTLEYGQAYVLQLTGIPPHQECTIFGGADTAGRLASLSIPVQCKVLSYVIGGSLTGLTERTAEDKSARLTITNGGDTLVLEKNTTTAAPKYTMPSAVAYDDPYAVVIAQQPAGQTCTIANPKGVLKTVVTPGVIVPPATTAPDVVTGLVDNIDISCVNNP